MVIIHTHHILILYITIYLGQWQRIYGFAAVFLELVLSLPFENIKNHMTHSAYIRLLEPGHQTLVRLIERRGVKALLRGFFPACWSVSLMYLVRLSVFSLTLPIFDEWAATRGQQYFDELRRKALEPKNEHLLRKKDGSLYNLSEYQYSRPIVGTIVIGTFATWCSIFVSMPFDSIKTKLQSPERPLYRGAMHCFTQTCRNSGFRSLWRGTSPRLVRATFATPIVISIYDKMLDQLKSSGPQPYSSLGRLDL